MSNSNVSWIAGIAALVSGTGVAVVQNIFEHRKSGAETSQIVQKTYSSIIEDLNRQIDTQNERFSHELYEAEARCDDMVEKMEMRLTSRIRELESELETLRHNTNREK